MDEKEYCEWCERYSVGAEDHSDCGEVDRNAEEDGWYV